MFVYGPACFLCYLKYLCRKGYISASMETNLEHLKLLKSRVTRTIDGYNAVIRELDRLQLAHQQLKVENQRLEDQLEVLREELKTAKLAQALNGNSDQDPRQMKLQINNYLREIDRCLALLNRD